MLGLLWLLLLCTQIGRTPSAENKFFDKTLPEEEDVLGEEDFQRARRQKRQLAEQEDIDDSAMYNQTRFEGDIVNPGLTAHLLKHTVEDSLVAREAPAGVQRNAVRQPYLKWPGAVIPYTISKQYLVYGRDQIAAAISEYATKTCVKFRPKTDADSDYVHILPDDGCYSLVGKVGGKQPVSLGDGCMSKGIIIHELMHSVGFFHEQSRADRDNYVNVLWDNIDPNLRDQFDKYSLNMIDYLGTKYDYGSVMHYGKYAFSKNGKETLEPREAGKKIGQRTGFSATDLYKINRLYECPGTAAQPPPSDSDSLLVSVSNPSSSSAAAGSSSPGVDANSNTVLIGGGGSSSCEDQRKDCAYLKDRGHCESIFSSAFMLIHCGRTCNKCLGEATSQCSDSMPYCPNWAAQGLCEVFIFQPYMHANCRDSCQLC